MIHTCSSSVAIPRDVFPERLSATMSTTALMEVTRLVVMTTALVSKDWFPAHLRNSLALAYVTSVLSCKMVLTTPY